MKRISVVEACREQRAETRAVSVGPWVFRVFPKGDSGNLARVPEYMGAQQELSARQMNPPSDQGVSDGFAFTIPSQSSTSITHCTDVSPLSQHRGNPAKQTEKAAESVLCATRLKLGYSKLTRWGVAVSQ